MILPICNKCGAELISFGAILLAPPTSNEADANVQDTKKYHICVRCWPMIETWLKAK